MRVRWPRPRSPRRGLTLVEMMVSVALLVLMMTILVTIFSAATGAVSGLQAFQQLDGDLRQLDMTIRQDLTGVTARMTPPLDPTKNLGYFEYGENAFPDIQGEDTDDYLKFTAKAPEGQLFMGRVWTGLSASGSATAPQPVFVTSQYAEIIYFLRNGNLYRRVLLVSPDRQQAINAVWTATVGGSGIAAYLPSMFTVGSPVSWQGVNDLSAHPSTSSGALVPVVLNTLGDLTNRENRYASPRFANDFVNTINPTSTFGDGIPDDLNPDPSNGNAIVGNGVPDFYPTLYSSMPSTLIFETSPPTRAATTETMAFPYVYPGMYSQPDSYGNALSGGGWIHSLDPSPSPPYASYFDQLLRINHSPMENGDSLSPPAQTSVQTWWGFPTWKETMSPTWLDPTVRVPLGPTGTVPSQPDGLHPYPASATPLTSGVGKNLLPAMTAALRLTPQPFNDGLPATTTLAPTGSLWAACWDDDLILTGVRSFDVKAYDDAFSGYADLGWGDDLRLYSSPPATPQYLTATPLTTTWLTGTYNTVSQTLAHEGRMPPLVADQRLDANYPYPFAFYLNGGTPYSGYSYTGNIGDNGTTVMRLRRVWDSWSTAYTQAPSNAFDPTTKLPLGPPFSPPVYPSYPPPYPAPLRGIQIQIRVTDPRSERVKVMTIRQDFSDKL